MNNRKIEEFFKRYSITSIEYTRANNYSRYDYVNTASGQLAFHENQQQNVDIEIPLRALEHLVKMDDNAEEDYRARKEEARMRKNYPALEEAYSKYQMLLALCR